MDEQRRITDDVMDALQDAGMLSVGAPAAFGGSGVDLDVMFEIAYELGRGCASVGWTWMIWNLHSWYLGYASQQAQEELYADGPDVVISSGYNPGGASVEMVDGGCMLSGKWSFSSGIDYAKWMLVSATPPGMVRPLGAIGHLMLVEREHVRVIDDWYVMGMKATGSKSFVIDEPVFVPRHRFLDMMGAESGPAKLDHGRFSYGVPNEVSIQHVVVAPFIGSARTAIDFTADDMKVRQNSFSGARKTESVNIQLRLGEAEAEIDSALSRARTDLKMLLEWGAAGHVMTPDERATQRLHHAYNLLLARRAITRIFDISGSPGMFTRSPLSRIFCDVYAASKHFALLWDEHAESYGRVKLGLDANVLQG
jgi:3-hydroxy-9,10-secoandrosta-1,3,5(10)-triene-9,17-dione monooxygenase